MPSKYVDIAGVATFLRHTGATTLPEAPPDLSRGEIVLCLHHGGGNSRNYDAFSAALCESHSPVSFDLPGHDRSGTQVGLGDIAAMADFAASVLKALHADRPAVVVGHGMGGNVALQLALEHKEMIRAVVVANTSASYTCGDEIIERTRLVSIGRARRDFDMKAYAPGCEQKVIRSGYMDTLKTDPRVLYPNLIALRDWPGAGRISTIDVPTLVCSGAGEGEATLGEAERMAGEIVGAQKAVIEGAARMLPTEKPAELASIVAEFLGGLS
ncbi:MAG: pimeloyl-ACP methyl ester carboxylesterase [Myxococcota bacterium]|jgi:pimeloyl-ACP methyl ester carboxylesterase